MSTPTRNDHSADRETDVAVGVAWFAASLLVMVGAFQVIQGVVALANDPFYVVGAEYIFQLDVTTWGWIHLLLGALIILVGVFLFRGAAWARWTAVGLAGLSALANFMWLPHYPFWSLVIITADVVIIWALTTRGAEIDDALS